MNVCLVLDGLIEFRDEVTNFVNISFAILVVPLKCL